MSKSIHTVARAIFASACIVLIPTISKAQTDIHIAGARAGFPVAVPQLCDSGDASNLAVSVPQTIAKDLSLSGSFNVLNPNSYVETPGKCVAVDKVTFSDWSVIGAEGLVRGQIRQLGGGNVEIMLYLFDVQQQRPVIGKKYESDSRDVTRVAHRFANEIIGFFTGEKGPFGTQIAYIGKVGRFKELFVMDLDGTNVRQLTSDRGLVLSPSWSPGADRIIFTSYKTRRPEIYIGDPSGGDPKQLTRDGSLKLGAKFFPNGSSIIAANSVAGSSNIVTYDLRGSITQRLTTNSAIDVSPSLSPDGRMVAFCSNRSGGPQIYTMSAGGGDAKRISFTNSDYCTSPAWSPKGDKIAFVCRTGGNQLFVSGVDGSQPLQLTFGGNNEDPSWSPDGRFLAFSSSAVGHGRGLAILPLLTGAPKSISVGQTEETQPAWSPKVE